jgi:DNA-binding transcriptional MerR regulator
MFSLIVIIAVVVLIVASAALVYFLIRRSDSGIVYHNDGHSQSSAQDPVLSFNDLGLTREEIARLHQIEPQAPPEGILLVESPLVTNALEKALQTGKSGSGLITRFNGKAAIDVRKIADPQQRAEIVGLIQQLNGQSDRDLDLKEAIRVVQYISKQL